MQSLNYHIATVLMGVDVFPKRFMTIALRGTS